LPAEGGRDDQPDHADEFDDAQRHPGSLRQRAEGWDVMADLVEHEGLHDARGSVEERGEHLEDPKQNVHRIPFLPSDESPESIDPPLMRQRFVLRLPELPFLCTRKFQASWSPLSNCSGFAPARRTCVAPCLPQPPETGRNTSGASSMSDCCNSGDSIRFPNPRFSWASVAKIRPPTRKSAAPM